MGGVYAKNVVNDTLDEVFDIFISATQNCSTVLTEEEALNFQGCSDVNISHINFSEYYQIDTKCLQSTKTQTQIDSAIKQKIQQIAKSITQDLKIPSGTTEAENILNILNKLAFDIKEQFFQNCSAKFTGTEAINCVDSKGISVTYVKFDETMDDVRSCAMNNTAVTQIISDLSQQISQTSTAKVKGLFSGLLQLLIILIIIAAVIFIMFIKGIKTVLNPVFLLVVGLLILGALMINYFLNWLPYKKVTKNQSKASQEQNKKFNTGLFFLFLGLSVVDIIALIFVARARRKKALEEKKTGLNKMIGEKEERGGNKATGVA